MPRVQSLKTSHGLHRSNLMNRIVKIVVICLLLAQTNYNPSAWLLLTSQHSFQQPVENFSRSLDCFTISCYSFIRYLYFHISLYFHSSYHLFPFYFLVSLSIFSHIFSAGICLVYQYFNFKLFFFLLFTYIYCSFFNYCFPTVKNPTLYTRVARIYKCRTVFLLQYVVNNLNTNRLQNVCISIFAAVVQYDRRQEIAINLFQ